MTSTYTPNINLQKPANGDLANTWDTAVNPNMAAIDQKFGAVTTINITGNSGTVALTQNQLVASEIFLTGALTGNATYTIPSGVQGYWLFVNGNSATSYSVTIAYAGGGTSVTIPNTSGNFAFLVCDPGGIKKTGPFTDNSYSYGATASYGDKTTKLATTAFVTNAINGAQTLLTGNTTLSAANAWPINILGSSSSPITFTFPSPSARLMFAISNVGTSTISLSFPSGTDYKTVMYPGEAVLLAGDGGGFYRVVSNGLNSGSGGTVGFRNIPLSGNTTGAAADAGKYLRIPSGTTINSGIFSEGDTFVLLNNTATPVTITQGGGVTLRLTGTTSTGNRTLGAYSMATVFCDGSNVFYVSGAGVS